MLEYSDLELIIELFHKKNITNTAKSLHISQPAITRRIKQMEEQLGVDLIIRNRRGVQFTVQGEYLAEKAKIELSNRAKLLEQMYNLGDCLRGTIRIGATNYFSKYKLPEILKAFKDIHPLVTYTIKTGWSGEVFRDVYNHDVHVGFIRGDYSWNESKELLFEENLCVASKKEIDLNNLPEQEMIEYESDNMLKMLVDNWWSENFSRDPKVIMSVNKVDTCKEMVVNGLGYGILPKKIIEQENNVYTKDLINKDGTPLKRKTWMYHRNDVDDLKTVLSFIEFVKRME
ncbi:LysR family transcriptional regulator [Terribacillus saccharophilus]|uniref:LysR family transcriptional regulator n=1 Tax=Terribacillus saccharophilus TaxID=361277 RepID=UPI002989A845|nr:LysR family transcriptional regulator [Terribacillus saccharophilus]MCM3224278.1 LysR family transcriptional regulator [Terribacillus saccharophilus]